MKPTLTILILCLLSVVGHVHAQRFPTNNVSQEQAVKIASRLWAGMTQAEVEKVVDKQHSLKSGANVGSPITGWTRFYLLSNDCRLDLSFDPKGRVDPKERGTNFLLSAAHIRKRTGETVVTITLTNAPSPGAGTQPSR